MKWAVRPKYGRSLLLPFLAFLGMSGVTPAAPTATQPAGVKPDYSCAWVPPLSSPMAGMTMATQQGEALASPGASSIQMNFDLYYIDMMIPHHASIIALAQVALPELTDPRLQGLAKDIITTQGKEIDQLRSYREAWYGSAEPTPLNEQSMAMMMQLIPGLGSIQDMAMQMNSQAQIAAFCADDDPDLAFIDLTISHHQMAIAASQGALTMATHEEIKTVAQMVIDAQLQEITELMQIRTELAGMATPSA